MEFIFYNGNRSACVPSMLTNVNDQFIELKDLANNIHMLINRRTAANDQDWSPCGTQRTLEYWLREIGDTIQQSIWSAQDTSHVFEIGLNFAGMTMVYPENVSGGQLKFGMPEVKKLVDIKDDSFIGKFLGNLDPSINIGRSSDNPRTLRGTISRFDGGAIHGRFAATNVNVNYLREDWIDYIRIR